MKIYHTETQEDYDALMVELEEQGCKWSFGRKLFGRKLSEVNNWHMSEHLTCIRVYDSKVNHASLNYYKEEYPDITITKYKAKADDKMKFTKENVEKVIDEYFLQADLEPCGDLIAEIYNLDDKPEKIVVPKFVADWIELCKEKANLIDCLQGSYHHYNGSEIIKEDEDWLFEGNNQDVVARAWLDGYEVEKEPLYEVIIAGRHLLKLFHGRIDHEFAEKTELCAWAKAAYQLTEAEIKAIDERYWPFAVPAND